MPELKDCEWVVERCKQHLSRNDRHNAKAWILTARSLFPENFAVQVGSVHEIAGHYLGNIGTYSIATVFSTYLPV